MRSVNYLIGVIAFIAIPGLVFGSHKGKRYPKSKPVIAIIEAYTQRTLPGRKEGKIQEATHVIAVWKGEFHPGNVYWENNGEIIPCNIFKVHKNNQPSKPRFPAGVDYFQDNVPVNQLQKGDTLDFVAGMTTAKQIPADIPKNLNNCLLFQDIKDKYLIFAVPNLSRKRDIAMP